MTDLLKRFLPGPKYAYHLLAAELIFLFLVLAAFFNFYLPQTEYPSLYDNGNEFTVLADSFLSGRLDLWKYPVNSMDCSMAGGKCYWALGPFPALLLVPPVLLSRIGGLVYYQGNLNFVLLLVALYLCRQLARRHGYSKTDSLWLAAGFCFASVAVGCFFNSLSWYYSQSVAVVIMLAALLEFFNKKRYWLIGSAYALLAATRLTAGLTVIFFLAEIFFDKKTDRRQKIRSLLELLLPLGAGLLLLGWYNYLRFGNPLETGYDFALIGYEATRQLRDNYGMFNAHFLLNNFYYYFLKPPEAVLDKNYFLTPVYLKVSPLGLSFFLVSPLFVRIFWAKLREPLVKYCLLATLPVLFILLLYYNTGSWQYGPRYLLDILPFWFLLLLFGFPQRRLTVRYYLLITISALANFFLYLILLSGVYY